MGKSHSNLLAIFFLVLLVACTQSGLATLSPGVSDDSNQQSSAQVLRYDLGEATLLQDHFPEDSRFRNMPVRLLGAIGVPGGEAAHPVVLILHGSHLICTGGDEVWPCPPDAEQDNYAGFTYLVEALANAGYVALSIDINAEYTFAFGEAPPTTRAIQLIEAHLKELAAANRGESEKFGLDLRGRIDLSQMVWMGHSRGGDFVNWIVREQNLAKETGPGGYGPVQGLILMAPPVFSTEALPAVDLPMAVILPACDTDVILLDGQKYYESARFDPLHTQPVTSVYLEGGNHENFNAILSAGSVPEDRPDCVNGAVLTPETQQNFMARYSLEFLKWLYSDSNQRGEAAQVLGLDPGKQPSQTLFEQVVQVNTIYPPADRLNLIMPESGVELSKNLLGGPVQMDGVTMLYCPQGYYTPEMEPGSEACQRVYFNQPGYPQQFVLQWETPEAEWRTALPAPTDDLSSYTSLSLRVALNPLSDLNPQGEAQAFSLGLKDASGNHATAVISDIPYPVGERKPSDYFEGESFSGHVHMKTIILPLSDFPGIDLAKITEIDLSFDQRDSGELFVADLAFFR